MIIRRICNVGFFSSVVDHQVLDPLGRQDAASSDITFVVDFIVLNRNQTAAHESVICVLNVPVANRVAGSSSALREVGRLNGVLGFVVVQLEQVLADLGLGCFNQVQFVLVVVFFAVREFVELKGLVGVLDVTLRL